MCTGNSCRSQMAEALWNQLGEGQWVAVSAGADPAGYVHPLAVTAMKEVGADISDCRSKHLNEFLDLQHDLVVTVCDSAREACPVWPNAESMLHWPFDDPAEAAGTDEEQLSVFRRVREEIADRIKRFLAEAG